MIDITDKLKAELADVTILECVQFKAVYEQLNEEVTITVGNRLNRQLFTHSYNSVKQAIFKIVGKYVIYNVIIDNMLFVADILETPKITYTVVKKEEPAVLADSRPEFMALSSEQIKNSDEFKAWKDKVIKQVGIEDWNKSEANYLQKFMFFRKYCDGEKSINDVIERLPAALKKSSDIGNPIRNIGAYFTKSLIIEMDHIKAKRELKKGAEI